MKNLFLFLFCSISIISWGHDVNYSNVLLRNWTIEKDKSVVEGSFYFYKNGEVYIEDDHNTVKHFPITSLSKDDQEFVNKRVESIQALNFANSNTPNNAQANDAGVWALISLFVLSVLLGIYILKNTQLKKLRYLSPLVFMGIILSLWGFTKKVNQIQTDPNEMDLAFIPFKPAINTFWDATYFHVESKGIPDHEMMTGITAWQQQVPIPQCYIGTNSWSIPLNPVIADTAVPVNTQHFLRGAVAVAVNGVAIFNPYTNTGVDALADGQLDIYGGHCGRADDYHYHIAPTVLYNTQVATLPIAYALDGFAVYGAVEPEGNSMLPLDENHGHYGTNGVYHYHGTNTLPYMIGKMVGQITEDNTMQIIPQAAAHPVRPSLTPLNGATITGCVPNATNNGYTLSYTRSGITYYVDFSWTPNGHYTYNFISPTDTVVENYTGFVQCDIVTNVLDVSQNNDVVIFPNPNNGKFEIKENLQNNNSIDKVSIYTLDGKSIFSCDGIPSINAIPQLKQGVYIVSIKSNTGITNRKIVVN